MGRLGGTWWLGVVLLMGATGARAAAPDGERSASVVLILDASSSMLGAIGKGNKARKMKVARDVTHELLAGWDARMQVGLTAYGHRKPKSCTDIEAVVPLGPLNRQAFSAAVDRLKPRGRTPLAAALRNAAEQLGYAHRKATVIVITDGLENCGGDPCAVAAELRQKGIDFRAHVVGLGAISSVESKQLACVAEKGGGEYHDAKDAAALKAALGGLVDQLAEQGGLRSPTVGAGGASLRELPETAANVQITSVRTPGGAPLRSVWRIWNADKTKQVGLADQKQAAAFDLAPGQYRLLAREADFAGNAEADLPFEVSPGQHHALELAYNSGHVTFSTFEVAGGPPVDSVFRIRRKNESDVAGVADWKSAPQFELLAGHYELAVELGNARVRREFAVQPGSETAQNVDLDIGVVIVTVVASPGGQTLHDAHWRIFQIAADGSLASAGSTDYHGQWDFTLEQGDYVARVEIDGGRKGEKHFSVKAGGKTREELVMGK